MLTTQNPKTAKHIGWNVVAYGNKNKIELMQSLASDDGVYTPAQSILICGEDSIKNLRDFCDEALKNETLSVVTST